MFRAFKRLFIWLGIVAEWATETDAINEAVVERGIRDAKAKADKAVAARKNTAERRKVARAERRKNAERGRQIAVAAAKMQASAKREELRASPSVGSSVGFAPQASSQPPFDYDRTPVSEAP